MTEQAVTESAAIEPPSVGGRHYLLVGSGSAALILLVAVSGKKTSSGSQA